MYTVSGDSKQTSSANETKKMLIIQHVGKFICDWAEDTCRADFWDSHNTVRAMLDSFACASLSWNFLNSSNVLDFADWRIVVNFRVVIRNPVNSWAKSDDLADLESWRARYVSLRCLVSVYIKVCPSVSPSVIHWSNRPSVRYPFFPSTGNACFLLRRSIGKEDVEERAKGGGKGWWEEEGLKGRGKGWQG